MAKELGYFLNGLNRDERLIKALLPGSIRLEDRNTNDLIRLISDLSRHVVYYNDSNRPEGDWEEFFKSDFNILNNLITSFDLQAYLKYFYQLEIVLEKAVNDKDVLNALRNIFYFTFAAALKMYEITDKLLAVQRTDVFKERLREILSKLLDSIALLRAYNQQAGEVFNVDFIDDRAFEHEGFKKKLQRENIFNQGVGVGEKTGNAFKEIKDVFNTLRKSFNRVLNACRYYVEENPLVEQTYRPHLALMITFLELYSYLKTDINKIPARHLDFYYQRILGFSLLPAKADQISLLFEPLPDAKHPVLEKGELVVGNLPGEEDEILFSLDNRLPLNQTHITSLKTLYTHYVDRIKFKNDMTTLREAQRYREIYENPEVKSVVKNGDKISSWPIFGQAINELNAAQRKKSIAETGFLIASPILYQPHASRKFYLKLHIEHHSFGKLMDYLFAYHGTPVGDEDVKYMLMENAFIIKVTGATGWEVPAFTRVSVNQEDESVDITLHQEFQDSPLTIYSALHGNLQDIKWPAVRLMINHEANFNPLAYVSMLGIVRISLRAEVKGATNYALQNMIGPLSNASAFQPFGPLAPPGSYFDIINPNIFNRFLTEVGLSLDWAGLPVVPGGFDTHYKNYDAGIKNSSFRARLLSRKTAESDQKTVNNEFPLFEDDFDANYERIIKRNTSFTKQQIDIRELAFVNEPNLDQNVQLMMGEMSEGALRIVLHQPGFAFGHASFQQLFSDTALHNARRFVKKRPLPKQPYTPLLNNIYIDYTQHTSEQLNNVSGNTAGLNTISFFHIMPFGHEQIFPGEIRSYYPLLAEEPFDNNFYIGFDQVAAGEELSILFHLEEKASHESAIKLEPLNWSYLYKNSWLPMNEKFLLSDTTVGLITSGIVRLIIPSDINLEHTVMPDDKYWIRISQSGRHVLKSKIKALYTNAVTATRVLKPGIADFPKLPPGVITSFLNPVKGIQNIWQLFPSYGGKGIESQQEFYMRVSQRLRHKNRLLLARDIEQAILENFPNILVAKCVRIEEAKTGVSKDPTKQKVVLVAQSEDGESRNLTPMVSLETLCDVRDFLQPQLSPQISVSVENPIYERIKVVCKVRLVPQGHLEKLKYATQLENDINEFISPWYFRVDINYRIGRKLFVAEMLNFIKSKSYISSVEEFGLAHFSGYHEHERDLLLTNLEDSHYVSEGFLTGSVPEAIFIPADSHYIEIMEEEIKAKQTVPDGIGLGYLSIGEELLIGDGEQPGEAALKKLKDTTTYYNWVIAKK